MKTKKFIIDDKDNQEKQKPPIRTGGGTTNP